MIKKIIHSLPVLGYRRFQTFFERLHNFALTGMNIGRAGSFENDGELAVVRYIRDKEKDKNLVTFDVGANIGQYTQMLVRELGAKTQTYSFEPSQKTFQTLSQNISSDPACKDRVTLLNVGLSNKAEEVPLFTDAENSGLASVYKRRLDHFNIAMDKKETVSLTTLDEFCEKNKIGRIDFLKMDVEGHELSVLQGAQKMLDKKAITYIQFEFGGNNIDSRTFFQDFFYLLKDDFTLFRVVKNGLCPITEYKESYESFLCTVFFAERK